MGHSALQIWNSLKNHFEVTMLTLVLSAPFRVFDTRLLYTGALSDLRVEGSRHNICLMLEAKDPQYSTR